MKNLKNEMLKVENEKTLNDYVKLLIEKDNLQTKYEE